MTWRRAEASAADGGSRKLMRYDSNLVLPPGGILVPTRLGACDISRLRLRRWARPHSCFL